MIKEQEHLVEQEEMQDECPSPFINHKNCSWLLSIPFQVTFLLHVKKTSMKSP